MDLPAHLRVYSVGGAVRDSLLGLPVQDRDFVVVGATPEEMVRLGFQPVGKDFPVFLHPTSHEEYALARTERKAARGYKGFKVRSTPDVTLEEDLRRRDLTINAMAMDAGGTIIDPYGGRADLAARVLRHVSPAFAEDPVRILRLARFAARFVDFEVAAETLTLMADMVRSGEIDALVPERVWQEISRGLMETRPSRMFRVLRQCGALARLVPELDRLFNVVRDPANDAESVWGDHVLRVVDATGSAGHPLAVRFAALCHDLDKGAASPEPQPQPQHADCREHRTRLVQVVCARLRVPSACRELAVAVVRSQADIHAALDLDPGRLLAVLENTDAFRRPGRFREILLACEADHRVRPGLERRPFVQMDHLLAALAAAQSVDTAAIAAALPTEGIAAAIRAARQAAIAAQLFGATPPSDPPDRNRPVLDTRHHDRDNLGLTYVYPVVSRRAGGLSIGVNVNVNNACNWRCIYCQVPNLRRGGPPPVDLGRLEAELHRILDRVVNGDFLATWVPATMRRFHDIALSGNGEPTSAKEFPQIVELIGRLMTEFDLLGRIKLVLISNGSLMHKHYVQDGLERMARLGGEVWFKLDRATRQGMLAVNNSEMTPERVLANLRHCARRCPTWIQTCLFTLDGKPPDERELLAYLDLLRQSQAEGIPLGGVLLYGLARASTQPEAPRLAPLDQDTRQQLVHGISAIGLTVHSVD